MCVSLLVITVSCAKMAALIEMPFGMWTWVGRRNRVLGGVDIPLGEGKILEDIFGLL